MTHNRPSPASVRVDVPADLTMALFATLTFLAIEIGFVAFSILALFYFRRRIGLTPLFLFIGSHQYLQTVLAATVYLPLAGPYATSPGSSVLFASTLFAILLVYLREDVPETRRMIYGIVLANATLTLLSFITHAQISSGVAMNVLHVPIEFFQINPRLFVAGTLVLIFDSFLVIVVYEFLGSGSRGMPLFLKILMALLSILWFDSIAFTLLSFAGTPAFWEILIGQLIGKSISGAAFAAVLYVYLCYVDQAAPYRVEGEFRDVFTILTYRERYEQILTEKEKQTREHEAAIRQAEERYGKLFDGSREAIALVDQNSYEVVRANAAMAALLQRDISSIVGTRLNSILGVDPGIARDAPDHDLAEFRELTIPRPDGSEVNVEIVGSAHIEQGQRMIQYYFRDVTARVRAERQLIHDAFHDRLTGLPNRALFMDRLERLLTTRHRHEFALVFLDLDRFKNVNDSLGHVIGDELLLQVGQRMLESVRNSDSIARLGGDEFGFILDDVTNAEESHRAVERIQQLFTEPFIIQTNELSISASCGIVLCSDAYARPEEMLRDADTAMYRAKAFGRARNVMFDDSMRESVVAFLSTESGLRGAVSRGEIELEYQPIFNLMTGAIAGVEALARWRRGDELIAPNDFIPVAEETGIIVSIGRYILETACAQASRWQNGRHRELSLAVNLSARQFQSESLLDVMRSAFSASGFSPHLLQIEITESVLMDPTPRTLAMLAELRTLGVTFAIDDFGTGWSSLAYLQKLPIDVLKIDRSFVADIHHVDDAAEIPTAIVLLAESLGIGVVAEGIETSAQLEKLRRLRCGFAQGFLLGRPVPAAEIDRLLEQTTHPIAQA